ncbi:1614_t:CDS:2, partial [Funneliformis geosporum]
MTELFYVFHSHEELIWSGNVCLVEEGQFETGTFLAAVWLVLLWIVSTYKGLKEQFPFESELELGTLNGL